MRRKVQQRWSVVLVVILGLVTRSGYGLPQQKVLVGTKQLICNGIPAVATVVEQLGDGDLPSRSGVKPSEAGRQIRQNEIVSPDGTVNLNTFEDCLQAVPTVVTIPDATISVGGSVFLVEHSVGESEPPSEVVVVEVTDGGDGSSASGEDIVDLDGGELVVISPSNPGSPVSLEGTDADVSGWSSMSLEELVVESDPNANTGNPTHGSGKPEVGNYPVETSEGGSSHTSAGHSGSSVSSEVAGGDDGVWSSASLEGIAEELGVEDTSYGSSSALGATGGGSGVGSNPTHGSGSGSGTPSHGSGHGAGLGHGSSHTSAGTSGSSVSSEGADGDDSGWPSSSEAIGEQSGVEGNQNAGAGYESNSSSAGSGVGSNPTEGSGHGSGVGSKPHGSSHPWEGAGGTAVSSEGSDGDDSVWSSASLEGISAESGVGGNQNAGAGYESNSRPEATLVVFGIGSVPVDGSAGGFETTSGGSGAESGIGSIPIDGSPSESGSSSTDGLPGGSGTTSEGSGAESGSGNNPPELLTGESGATSEGSGTESGSGGSTSEGSGGGSSDGTNSDGSSHPTSGGPETTTETTSEFTCGGDPCTTSDGSADGSVSTPEGSNEGSSYPTSDSPESTTETTSEFTCGGDPCTTSDGSADGSVSTPEGSNEGSSHPTSESPESTTETTSEFTCGGDPCTTSDGSADGSVSTPEGSNEGSSHPTSESPESTTETTSEFTCGGDPCTTSNGSADGSVSTPEGSNEGSSYPTSGGPETTTETTSEFTCGGDPCTTSDGSGDGTTVATTPKTTTEFSCGGSPCTTAESTSAASTTASAGSGDGSSSTSGGYGVGSSGSDCYGVYDELEEQAPLDFTETGARNYINEVMPVLQERYGLLADSVWQVYSDVNEFNYNVTRAIQESNMRYLRSVAKHLRRYDFTIFQDKDLQRMTRMLSKYGYGALSCERYEKLQEALMGMLTNYNEATVCAYQSQEACDVPLTPDVVNIMATSRDPEELKHYWIQWHDTVGKPSKRNFKKYVGLTSESALLNGFPSMAEYWLDAYEHRRFEEEMSVAMNTISQLYVQLHGYIRYKIRQTYGEQYQEEYGPIQINLLGDMWGESWENIAPLAMPYPEYANLDVTGELIEREYTPQKMFEVAEDFFRSINMSALPSTFWDNCVLEEPSDDSNAFCDPAVLDMFEEDDIRVRMCTKVNGRDLSTVFRLVARAQYMLQYRNQPAVYRDEANPGFLETIGQLISQLTSTPRYLTKVHLLSGYRNTRERRVNRLFLTAMKKVAFLPFAYSVDQYRMEVFRHGVSRHEYNCKFWELRSRIAGVEPPVKRNHRDFDPAALQYVSADIDYIQHIFSTIAQFQLQKGLCRISGDYGHRTSRHELSDCNIFGSAAAGNALKGALQLGSSKSWTKILYALTGYRGLNAEPMLEYFQPLYDWLKRYNQENHVPLGWVDSARCTFED